MSGHYLHGSGARSILGTFRNTDAILKTPIVVLLCLVAFASTASAQVSVTDGDTLEVDGTTYRLNGMDAPEFGQDCNGLTGTWKCGKAALAALVKLVEGQSVRCDPISEDGYGRTIATCYADNLDVGGEMVRTGFAWAFIRYSKVYIAEESEARESKAGIWRATTQPAWEYRAAKWEVAKQDAPEGCPIKGNISKNGRIYHPPWSPWYSRTKVSVDKGERWFCSEAEAVEAGWRAPRWK